MLAIQDPLLVHLIGGPILHNYNVASFLVTEECNLACTYCFEKYGEDHVGGVMTEEVAEQGLQFLANANDNSFTAMLFGGEPTLNPKICEYIIKRGYDIAQERGKEFIVQLVTNATLFPESLANVVFDYRDKCSIQVQISIDGVKPAQDAGRIDKKQNSTFETVRNVAKKWKELLPDNSDSLVVHGCLSPDTIGHMLDSYQFFKEELNIHRMWFFPICEAEWKEEHVESYREATQVMTDDIIAQVKEQQSLDPISLIEPFSHALGEPSGKINKPCGAGDSFCTITAKGDIYPCHQFYFAAAGRSLKLGDVEDGVDPWKAKFYQKYDGNDLNCDSDCNVNNCYRCIAVNWQVNSNMLSQPKDFYCEFMRIDNIMQEQIRTEAENMGLMDQGCSAHSADTANGCDVVSRPNLTPRHEAGILEQLVELQERRIAFDSAYIAQLTRLIQGD